jgi:hypothetical protein
MFVLGRQRLHVASSSFLLHMYGCSSSHMAGMEHTAGRREGKEGGDCGLPVALLGS